MENIRQLVIAFVVATLCGCYYEGALNGANDNCATCGAGTHCTNNVCVPNTPADPCASCAAGTHCTNNTCVVDTPPSGCTEGATSAPDNYCANTFCPNRGQVADHLVCAANGGWSCVCRAGTPAPTCATTCPTGTHCEGVSCVADSIPSGNCTPGATCAPDTYCANTFCPQRGQIADHLVCAVNGSWGCVCRDGSGPGPAPSCGTCAAGTHCVGTSCVPDSTPVSDVNTWRVRITLPASAPAATGFGIKEEATQFAFAPGCQLGDVTGPALSVRSHECTFTVARGRPIALQGYFWLSSSILYTDAQNGNPLPARQTEIYSCTQGDIFTPFDAYGTMEVWRNGTYLGIWNGSSGFLRPNTNRNDPRNPTLPCESGCNVTPSDETPLHPYCVSQ